MDRFDHAGRPPVDGSWRTPRRRALLRVAPVERGRWLSAVLIVAAIGATTVAVRVWPARIAAPAASPASTLPVRTMGTMTFVDAPRALLSASASARARPTLVQPAVSLPLPTAEPVVAAPALPPVVETIATDPAPAVAAADAAPAGHATPLASRRIDIPTALPVAAAQRLEDGPSGSALAFVELPAVAVTRAVAVAGRGIRTGLRATGAVFKAAF